MESASDTFALAAMHISGKETAITMKPSLLRSGVLRVLLAGVFLFAGPAARANLTIQFDYSLDTSGFFSGDNIARRALLDHAAVVFTSRITDSLDAIAPGGGNTWTAVTFNPANTGVNVEFTDLVVALNTLIVYVGASDLPGSTLGLGGPGGFGVSGTQGFVDTVIGRGQAGALAAEGARTDFAPWGGSLAFDSLANWSFDSDPTTVESFTGQNDFFSVAVHELAHLFGLGTAGSWDDQISGGAFTGANSVLANGGNVTLDGGLAHWANGTMSTLVGTLSAQEAARDPSLTTGTRKFFTTLDFAGLDDIGWQLSAIPEPSALAWAAVAGTLGMAWRRSRRA